MWLIVVFHLLLNIISSSIVTKPFVSDIFTYFLHVSPNMEPIFKAVSVEISTLDICWPPSLQLSPARLQEGEWDVDEEGKRKGLRILAPAMSDPYTAADCIDWNLDPGWIHCISPAPCRMCWQKLSLVKNFWISKFSSNLP